MMSECTGDGILKLFTDERNERNEQEQEHVGRDGNAKDPTCAALLPFSLSLYPLGPHHC